MMHNAGLSMRFGATATIFAGEMVALDNATTVRRAERGDVPFGIALGNAREDGMVDVILCGGMTGIAGGTYVPPMPRPMPRETCCHHCGGERWAKGSCYFCGTEKRQW